MQGDTIQQTQYKSWGEGIREKQLRFLVLRCAPLYGP